MKELVISDHALLRYIERVHGVDIEQLREIVSDLVEDAALAGATCITKDGFTYTIAQHQHTAVLTTVLFPEWRSKRMARHLRRKGACATPSDGGGER